MNDSRAAWAMSNEFEEVYIGDGVYARWNGFAWRWHWKGGDGDAMTGIRTPATVSEAPRLFIYDEDQDFSNGWIYHHWALLGENAGSAIWGI